MTANASSRGQIGSRIVESPDRSRRREPSYQNSESGYEKDAGDFDSPEQEALALQRTGESGLDCGQRLPRQSTQRNLLHPPDFLVAQVCPQPQPVVADFSVFAGRHYR